MDIEQFWRDVLAQDAERLREYFWEDAYINWHCTNEHFKVEEYIRANCEYPGDWDGEVERKESWGDLAVTVTRVWTKDRAMSFHVVSFMKLTDGRIASLDEYWGDDGSAPAWRLEKQIGEKIRQCQ